MNLRLITFSLILFSCYNALGQQESYFYKIQEITLTEHLASRLYQRLDSLEKTRRPNDSYIKLFFDRDGDFGFKHQRINLKFNGTDYQVNLLVKNDTITIGSAIFHSYFGQQSYCDYFNKKHGIPKIDSVKALNYLKLRNLFYNSSKTLSDLKNELEIEELYALRGGDGYNDTQAKKHLDKLVNERNFAELESMLKNINCEEQMYGVTGLGWLKKKKVKISTEDKKIINHIIKRNSELESSVGDIGPIIRKAFK